MVLRTLTSIFILMISDWKREFLGLGVELGLACLGLGTSGVSSEWAGVLISDVGNGTFGGSGIFKLGNNLDLETLLSYVLDVFNIFHLFVSNILPHMSVPDITFHLFQLSRPAERVEVSSYTKYC